MWLKSKSGVAPQGGQKEEDPNVVLHRGLEVQGKGT